MTNTNYRIHSVVFLLLSAIPIQAQTGVDAGYGSIGDPSQLLGNPASSYALSGIEHLNYYTGSLNVAIPILTIGGRGTVATTIKVPIQRRWSVIDGYPSSHLGVAIQYTPGNISFSTSSPDPNYYCYNSATNTVNENQATSYIVWQAYDGTQTYLTDTKYNGQPRNPDASCQPANRGRVFKSTDGTNLEFISDRDIFDGDGIPSGTLLTPDGTRYSLFAGGIVNQIQDRNGNQINYSWQGTESGGIYTVTDPVGRQSIINYTQSEAADAQDVLTYIGFQGQNRTITINYSLLENALGPNEALLPYSRLFPELDGSSSTFFNPYVISSVVLADGHSYQMGYNGYGELTKLVLPTGGYYTYWYDEAYNGGRSGVIPLTGVGYRIFRPLLGRDEHADGVNLTARMLFTSSSRSSGLDPAHPSRPGVIGTASFYEIVNNSLNLLRQEQHYFYGDPASNAPAAPPNTYANWWEGMEFRTDIANGSSPLQSVQRTYQQRPWASNETNQWFYPQDDAVPSHDPELTSETTTQGWAVKLTTYGYDTYSNRSDEWDYDWGPGAPNTFLRHLQTTYLTDQSYLNANLVSLPTSITIEDANGIWSSHRVLCYDEASANSGFSGTCQSPSSTRGNVTTDTSWLAVGQTFQAYPADQYAYDGYGNVLSHRDPNGYITTYTYSDGTYAHVNSITLPPANGVQQNTSVQYDYYTGKATQVIDSNAVSTSYSYDDKLDRLTDVLVAANSGAPNHLRYIYQNPTWTIQCQDKTTTNDCGIQTQTVYDGFGRLVENRQIEYDTNSYIATDTSYDALGRVHSTTNPSRVQISDGSRDGLGIPTYYSYDALNRPTSVTFQDGTTSTTSYNGNQNTVTDQAGAWRGNYLDGLDRLVAVATPVGNTYYEYDLLGNLQKVRQDSQTRTFRYDSLSRLVSATNPESGIVQYTYDFASNLKTKLDARGVTTRYDYDPLNRLTSKSYSGGSNVSATPSVAYAYGDASGVPYAKGKLIQVSNGSSLTNYTSFDPFGRVTSSSQVTGEKTYPFSYSYNLAGSLTSETYPSGRSVSTCYDGAGRTKAVVLGNCGAPIKNYVSGVAYFPHGAPNYYTLGNNLWPVYHYNSRLQMDQYWGAVNNDANQFLYHIYLNWGGSNNNGNLYGVTEGIGGPAPQTAFPYNFTQQFSYDGVNRLTSANDSGGWSRNYSYDPYGNASVTGVGLNPATPVSSAAYNGNNQLISTNPDAAGNAQTIGSYSLVYDAENRQVSETNTIGNPAAQYLYDGSGHRVQKTAGAISTIYVYDALDRLAAEYTTDASASPCQTCYLTADHLGSTRMVTGENAHVVSFHDYLPFGEEVSGNSVGRGSLFGPGTDQIDEKFTGQKHDQETGLDFFQARYYSAALGRFTSPDPANIGADPSDPQTWNGYAYVRNNPMSLVDPSGTCSRDEAGNWSDDDNFGPNNGGSFISTGACPTVNGAIVDPNAGGSVTVTDQGPTNVLSADQLSLFNQLSTTHSNPSAIVPPKNQTGTVDQPKQTGTYSAYSGCLIGAMPKILGTSAFGVGLTATAGRSYTNPIPPPTDILRKAPQRTFELGSKWGVKGQIVGAVVFLATYEVELNAAARSCSNSTGYTPWALEP